MRQPDFHAGQLPQQSSELFKNPVAGSTQPWIVSGKIHALLLSECVARMLKDVLLLDTGGTLHPQIHDSPELVGGEAFAPNDLQHVGLVARGQPHQLASGRRGYQSHL